jgi:CRISPR-associated endonuclease/helicase Cas3
MKKLAQYSVNIRERDFKKLQSMGAIDEPFENTYAITNPFFYKSDTGLTIDNQWLEETYII